MALPVEPLAVTESPEGRGSAGVGVETCENVSRPGGRWYRDSQELQVDMLMVRTRGSGSGSS